MDDRAPDIGDRVEDQPEPPDVEDRRALLAVPMHSSMIERIDEEVERVSRRTGQQHTRDQFLRHAAVELIDRLAVERQRERERGEPDG